MANLRQTILIRTDLGFPVGLLTAQVAHLHFQRFRTMITGKEKFTNDDLEWMADPYVYVHEAKNLETLNYYEKLAHQNKVPFTCWLDTVYIRFSETQMQAIPSVYVGLVLGPCDSDKIKAVIGDLPLLK